MTSTNQTSSGAKANLVSSSPELLTRAASKPDDRSISSTGELWTFSAAVGADMRRLTSLPSPGGEGALSFDIHQNLDFPTQNQFPKLNLAPVSEVAQASGQSGADLPVQRLPGPGLPASSTRPSTLNPEISQPIHDSRSATENRTETKLRKIEKN
jgi:hypothetical protein